MNTSKSNLIGSPISEFCGDAIGLFYWVRPCTYLPRDHPDWKPDRATPIEWEYLIHQSSGKFRLAWADGFTTEQQAQIAAVQAIEQLSEVLKRFRPGDRVSFRVDRQWFFGKILRFHVHSDQLVFAVVQGRFDPDPCPSLPDVDFGCAIDDLCPPF